MNELLNQELLGTLRLAVQECAELQFRADQQAAQIALLKQQWALRGAQGREQLEENVGNATGAEYSSSRNQIISKIACPAPFTYVDLAMRYYINKNWMSIFEWGDPSVIIYAKVD
ncbi:hypothetical protein SS50377_25975 [Spironucleus salmonicida]|uniref:Uncharacterized protein n=1 Tax=Spironucleus salmonicida TaxID=348837 RepID=V6LG36_9EUKA|nr:hypothetical protein SS50377_25975 [Spironucleus salmonicida]|eukprot:EST43238.1 Hypothetical protein SS50377_17103 [Spironucleus salmonicida]